MPAVTLKQGQYFVGDPKDIFPDWKPSPSCTYRAGIYTYQAFQFDDSFVAAIPVEAIPVDLMRPKERKNTIARSLMTFSKPVVFFEQGGKGAIDKVAL